MFQTRDSRLIDTSISEEARASLQRLLGSEAFARAPRLRTLLKFFIDSLFEGRAEEIHENTIGEVVFGRPSGYSHGDDNIVRVNVRLLRSRLEEYYRTAGRNEIWRIAIPKGRYVPELTNCPAQAEPVPTAEPDVVSDLSQLPTQRSRHVHLLWAVPAFCLLVGIAILVRDGAREHTASPPSPMATSVPFASFPGQEMTPAWAPDSTTLAYTWDEGDEGHPHVFLQRIGEVKPHRLTFEQNAEFRPTWSPDGKRIAFLRPNGEDKFSLVIQPLGGGAALTLATVSYFWHEHTEAPAIDWSPDGSQFVVSEQPTAYSPVRLILVNASTGNARVLTEPRYGTAGDLEAKFSPDGSAVAFRRGRLGDLFTVSIQGESRTPAKQLTSESMGVRGVSWSKDGRSVFFGRHGSNGRYSIWRVDALGGAPSPVSPLNIQATQPAISPDGRYLAFEHHDLVVNLMEERIDAPGHRRYLSPSNQLDGSPEYSPDGGRLVFTSDRSGFEEVWMQGMDGSTLQKITSFHGTGIPFDATWAPDGKSIAMAVRASGATNLFTYTLATGRFRQITSGTDDLTSPLYSKDGKYIYCSSNAEGAARIWRVAADGSQTPEHLFGDVAESFQESDDGKGLYFADSGAKLRIMRRDIQTGKLDVVYESDRRLYSPSAFAVRGDTLYMMLATSSTNAADLIALDLVHGKAKTVLHFQGLVKDIAAGIPILMGGITISPTGRSIVVPEMRHSSTDIYLQALQEAR